MVVRTYFDRNNTIVSNQIVNTGQNPVSELFYGTPDDQSFSRFIFQFSMDRLEEFRTQGMFPDLTKFTHTLRMTNTGAFDLSQMGKDFNGKERSSSFDLVLYPLGQEWDEGVGYDYYVTPFVNDALSISTSPSNWFESGTNTNWIAPGAISGATTIGQQHFEHGNENLEIDITPYVNAILSGATNNGLCLAYTDDLETTIREAAQYVGFFTRHTQTVYEPHIESIYDDRILDNRINFYLDKTNRLYLYSNIGGKPTNLDEIPVVTILNDEGTELLQTTATTASQGVYYVEINIPSSTQNDCTMYTDIWSNIIVNGVARPDIELDFSVKSEGYFNIGSDVEKPQDYMFSATGIKHGEIIKRGDVRKVIVNAKIPYTSNQMAGLENIQYRLYVKEGRNQFTIIDFQDMNMAKNQNYFLLDTMSLLPNTYFLDVKYMSDYEMRTIPEVIKFEIVSQSELRKSQ